MTNAANYFTINLSSKIMNLSMHHHFWHMINVMSNSHRYQKGTDIAKLVVHRSNAPNVPNILQTLNISKNIFQPNMPIPKHGDMFVKSALPNQNSHTIPHFAITIVNIMYTILSKHVYHMLLCLFLSDVKI